jgi:hypothetical protein
VPLATLQLFGVFSHCLSGYIVLLAIDVKTNKHFAIKMEPMRANAFHLLDHEFRICRYLAGRPGVPIPRFDAPKPLYIDQQYKSFGLSGHFNTLAFDRFSHSLADLSKLKRPLPIPLVLYFAYELVNSLHLTIFSFQLNLF